MNTAPVVKAPAIPSAMIDWAVPEAARRAVPKTATSTDMPSDPPTHCVVCNSPEAAPVSAAGTPARMIVFSGMKLSPAPRPNSSIGPATPVRYPLVAESWVSQTIPAVSRTAPVTMSGLAPKRGSNLGTVRTHANIVTVIGRNAAPVRSGPNPSTFWRNWVRKKNIPNMVADSSSMFRYAPQRLRSANSRSGITGCRARISIATNTASSTAAVTMASRVPVSCQPCEDARMKPYTRQVMPAVEVSAPARSKRPGRRSGSAMYCGASSTMARPTGTLTNSPHRHDAQAVSVPPSSRPIEAPAPTTAE